MLNNKNILVTGGTGSFGKAFVRYLVLKYPTINRLVIFSRDELKQFEMAQEFPHEKYPFIRYFLGDVRDKSRMQRAMRGIDTVVHAAALKQVPAAEYNPMEFVKTNVIGAENVIESSIDSGVKNVVALSTDKAAAPINLYGATKLCSDKLFVAANNIAGGHNIKFSVVRYGNVMGSRGSVIPFFLKKKSEGVLPVTDPNMTRFNILLEDAVKLVIYALENALGGEIFVPKIPSYRILDLAEAICPSCEKKIVGIRPGEKLHEEMITSSDAFATLDIGKYYAIVADGERNLGQRYISELKASPVPNGFSYNSRDNNKWLSIEHLRELINQHILTNSE